MMTGVGERMTANYMLKSRGEVWRSLQYVRSTALLWLFTSCFALCDADLPSSSVYRTTALLSRITYIWKSENISSVWTTIFFSNLFWCGRPFFSAKKKSWFFPKCVWVEAGTGLELVRVRLRSGVFLLKKMVDHIERHDRIFPDFYTLSSIIIQWCGKGYCNCYVEWKWLKMTAQRPERIVYLCFT